MKAVGPVAVVPPSVAWERRSCKTCWAFQNITRTNSNSQKTHRWSLIGERRQRIMEQVEVRRLCCCAPSALRANTDAEFSGLWRRRVTGMFLRCRPAACVAWKSFVYRAEREWNDPAAPALRLILTARKFICRFIDLSLICNMNCLSHLQDFSAPDDLMH